MNTAKIKAALRLVRSFRSMDEIDDHLMDHPNEEKAFKRLMADLLSVTTGDNMLDEQKSNKENDVKSSSS